jgi:hypothetical protein
MTENALAPPSRNSRALLALHFLKDGGFLLGPEWDKAHAICQEAEGTCEYDLVHALAHWIEGDISNRDYWYRRVGTDWKRAGTIEKEWEQISARLA